MKANELRIENIFEIDGEIRPFSISDFEYQNYDIAKPIPLTPSVLEAAWFNSHERSVSFGDSGFYPISFYYILEGVDDFKQRIYKHNFVLSWFKDGAYYQANQRKTKGVKLEYLHQLQNLYFALTGTELPIDTTKL